MTFVILLGSLIPLEDIVTWLTFAPKAAAGRSVFRLSTGWRERGIYPARWQKPKTQVETKHGVVAAALEPTP